MKLYSLLFLSILTILFGSCSFSQHKPEVVYQSENLIIKKLSDHVYQHISYLQTNDFGKVDCNGMIVVDENEAAVFDTPANAESSVELIDFLQSQNIQIKSVSATHFHEDCIGGLDEFHERNIPSYAHSMTIEKLKNRPNNVPQNGFQKELTLTVGEKKVFLNYFGGGHTQDNITAYFPDEKILFGGCLIKEIDASKGNLEDADEAAWAQTVQNLKKTYPEIKTVIPGHGTTGNQELLDYTISLFSK